MFERTLTTRTGNVKIAIPSGLNEITLGMIIDLQESGALNDFQALSILSGTPYQELLNIVNYKDTDVFNERVLSLVHQLQYVYDVKKVPEFVTFGDKKIKVMNNLSIEPAGAFMCVRDKMVEEINRGIAEFGEDDWKSKIKLRAKVCGEILAHYFYCKVTDQDYEEQKAEEFYKEVIKLPVQDAMAIATSFFLSWPDL